MIHNIKIKIMKAKPTLTDEEIRSHMDFNKLLETHKATTEHTVPKWMKITGYTTSAIIFTAAIFYLSWPMKEVVSESQNGADQPVVKTDSLIVNNNKIETRRLKEDNAKSLEQKPLVQPNQTKIFQRKEILKAPAFTEAEPIHGYPELYAYFNRELKYPIEALKDSVEGVVTVSFLINEQGKPTEINIINSLGALFDAECIRIVENMPAWRAATLNGTAISTRLSIPLTFRATKK